MSNPRLLVLTSTYPRWESDSTPRFVESLCIELSKCNLDVFVLAPHFPNSKSHEIVNSINIYRYRYAPASLEKIAYEGGLLNNIKRRRVVNTFVLISFMLCQLLAAIRLIYKHNCREIHAHWIIPQGLIAIIIKKLLFWRNIKVLITAHGGDIYGVNGKISTAIKNWVCKNCDAATVVSNAVARDIGYVKHLHIRSMGVDTSSLFIPPVNPSRSNLLFVGRLVDKKGCDVLIRAFQYVLNYFPTLQLNIIGEGPEHPKLVQLCKSLGVHEHVNFIGSLMQVELIKWYQGACIFIMPSVIASSGDQEGLGLVAAEAMACECPVIASDLEAIKDLIDDNHCGLLVKQGDAEKLSNAIVRLLEDQEFASKLAKNARKKVVTKFDWVSVGREYAQIIRDLSK